MLTRRDTNPHLDDQQLAEAVTAAARHYGRCDTGTRNQRQARADYEALKAQQLQRQGQRGRW